MTRPLVVLASMVSLLTLASTSMAAHDDHGSSYSYGYEKNHDNLGWAIISDDNSSMSDMDVMDSLDRLKDEFGDEFIYIRLGESRYVIRDRALMRRAKDAARPLQKAGREVGEAARAEVAVALGGVNGATREQAKLAARIAKLSARIARLEARGESTEDLEREQEQLAERLEELSEDSEREQRAAHRHARSHSAKSKVASERLEKAVRHLNEEMRDILRDAKSRRLAKRVD